ncbi:MAG: hypothetical protein ACFNZX_06705, partial [Actinomyces sp.]
MKTQSRTIEPAHREAAERELIAARAELSSLGSAASSTRRPPSPSTTRTNTPTSPATSPSN